MADLNTSWPWLSLAALGAFHGLNPAMGWLFAVALGLQERRLRAVDDGPGADRPRPCPGHRPGRRRGRHARARHPAAPAAGAGRRGAARLRRLQGRHPLPPPALGRHAGRTAGAGAVVVPHGLGARRRADAGPGARRAARRGRLRARWPTPSTSGTPDTRRPAASDALLPALAAVGLHAAAMLAVAGVVAVVVYQKLGVEVLRRAWVNLDLIWVGALVVAGGLALGLGLWPSLAGG